MKPTCAITDPNLAAQTQYLLKLAGYGTENGGAQTGGAQTGGAQTGVPEPPAAIRQTGPQTIEMLGKTYRLPAQASEFTTRLLALRAPKNRAPVKGEMGVGGIGGGGRGLVELDGVEKAGGQVVRRLPTGAGAGAGAEFGMGAGGAGNTVGIVGAAGGVGATTIAVGLAQYFAGQGEEVALVDLDPAGAGIDAVVGQEEAEGLRWPDFRGQEGPFDGREITGRLIRWRGVGVLSAGRCGRGVPEEAGVVVEALAGYCDRVILDLPRQFLGGQPQPWAPGRVMIAGRASARGYAAVLNAGLSLQARGVEASLVMVGRHRAALTGEVCASAHLPSWGAYPRVRGLCARSEAGRYPALSRRERTALAQIAQLGVVA